MPAGVPASTTVGAVTTPPLHVAWVTCGATGCTGVHATAGSSTVNVAVVSDVSVQPSGRTSGQPTPASRQRRRHRHRQRRRRRVDAARRVQRVGDPVGDRRRDAVRGGRAGRAHRQRHRRRRRGHLGTCGADEVDRERGRHGVRPASTRRHLTPGEPVGERRRHRDRGVHGAVVRALRSGGVRQPRWRGGQHHRRLGDHTVGTGRLRHRRAPPAAPGCTSPPAGSTVNVAVVAFTSVHPSGSGSGQATPAAASRGRDGHRLGRERRILSLPGCRPGSTCR